MNGDAYDWVQEVVPWRDMLREQNCDGAQVDPHATKVATGYTGLATKRAQIVISYAGSAIFECKRRPLEDARKAREAVCTDVLA